MNNFQFNSQRMSLSPFPCLTLIATTFGLKRDRNHRDRKLE